jgi:hypothetical protein
MWGASDGTTVNNSNILAGATGVPNVALPMSFGLPCYFQLPETPIIDVTTDCYQKLVSTVTNVTDISVNYYPSDLTRIRDANGSYLVLTRKWAPIDQWNNLMPPLVTPGPQSLNTIQPWSSFNSFFVNTVNAFYSRNSDSAQAAWTLCWPTPVPTPGIHNFDIRRIKHGQTHIDIGNSQNTHQLQDVLEYNYLLGENEHSAYNQYLLNYAFAGWNVSGPNKEYSPRMWTSEDICMFWPHLIPVADVNNSNSNGFGGGQCDVTIESIARYSQSNSAGTYQHFGFVLTSSDYQTIMRGLNEPVMTGNYLQNVYVPAGQPSAINAYSPYGVPVMSPVSTCMIDLLPGGLPGCHWRSVDGSQNATFQGTTYRAYPGTALPVATNTIYSGSTLNVTPLSSAPLHLWDYASPRVCSRTWANRLAAKFVSNSTPHCYATMWGPQAASRNIVHCIPFSHISKIWEKAYIMPNMEFNIYLQRSTAALPNYFMINCPTPTINGTPFLASAFMAKQANAATLQTYIQNQSAALINWLSNYPKLLKLSIDNCMAYELLISMEYLPGNQIMATLTGPGVPISFKHRETTTHVLQAGTSLQTINVCMTNTELPQKLVMYITCDVWMNNPWVPLGYASPLTNLSQLQVNYNYLTNINTVLNIYPNKQSTQSNVTVGNTVTAVPQYGWDNNSTGYSNYQLDTFTALAFQQNKCGQRQWIDSDECWYEDGKGRLVIDLGPSGRVDHGRTNASITGQCSLTFKFTTPLSTNMTLVCMREFNRTAILGLDTVTMDSVIMPGTGVN